MSKPAQGPFKSVRVSDDGNSLIIEVPIDHSLPLSSTGKTHLLYASGFPRPTGLFVQTSEIKVNCTAYIDRLPGKGD